MGRVIHFDIAADNIERAIGFYENVFGWEITKAGGPLEYWLISTGADEAPGIDGGIAPRAATWQRITCFVDVDSLAATLAKVRKQGGKIIQPKSVIPGEGYIAACEDTEGNVIGILERSPTAGF
jgi:predicted enzyme related to lactoylglutathione lyase